MGFDEHTEKLRRLRKQASYDGGPGRVSERLRRGAKSPRERVLALLDAGSFVELDALVEGAVCGHGRVDGRQVFVFSQDGETPLGALDERFARKLVKVADLAMKSGVPLVGFYDCGSWWGPEALARDPYGLSHGDHDPSGVAEDDRQRPLGAYSELYFRNVMASGFIPQVAVVVGPCLGPLAYSVALADFTVMVKGAGYLRLGDTEYTGKDPECEVSLEEAAGARTHAEKSGLAHLVADDEEECLALARALLSYLPQNNLEEPFPAGTVDPPDRRTEELEVLDGQVAGKVWDVRKVVKEIADEGDFLELSADWAKNLVVGFGRVGGRVVGFVANQAAFLDGRLNAEAALKGARFVRFCDAFNIPLVTLVDAPGLVEGDGGAGELLRGAAMLMYAYCEATVPKVSLVLRSAYGAAYEVMCPKHIRADFNLAWPSAQIAAVSAEGLLDRQESTSPYEAASRGYLDDIIEPAETRLRISAALEACASKREGRPPKKHGSILL